MFTIRYLLDKYGWEKCEEVFGWDPYFLKEGRALDTENQSVSEEELDKLEGRYVEPVVKEECGCKVVPGYTLLGQGLQPEKIVYCSLHDTAPELLEALEHAETRLNQVSTDYKNTNFKLIRETLAKARGN